MLHEDLQSFERAPSHSQQRWGMVLRDSITPSMDPLKVVMMHAGRGRYPVCQGLGLVSIASLEQWQIWTIVL